MRQGTCNMNMHLPIQKMQRNLAHPLEGQNTKLQNKDGQRLWLGNSRESKCQDL